MASTAQEGPLSVTVTLTPYQNASDVRTLEIKEGQSVIIGRASKAESKNLQASPTNALFDCPVVSREHALLEFDPTERYGDQVTIVSTGRHGTRVNGEELELDVPMSLMSGDMIMLGDRVMRGSDTHDGITVRFGRTPSKLNNPHTPVSRTQSTSRGYSVPTPSDYDSDDHSDGGESDAVIDVESSAKTTPEQNKVKLGSAEKPIDLDAPYERPKPFIISLDDDDDDDEEEEEAPVAVLRDSVKNRAEDKEEVGPARIITTASDLNEEISSESEIEHGDYDDLDDSEAGYDDYYYGNESELYEHSDAAIGDDLEGSEFDDFSDGDTHRDHAMVEDEGNQAFPSQKELSPELGSLPSRTATVHPKSNMPIASTGNKPFAPPPMFISSGASSFNIAPTVQPNPPTLPDRFNSLRTKQLPVPVDSGNTAMSRPLLYSSDPTYGPFPATNFSRTSRWDIPPVEPYSQPTNQCSGFPPSPVYYTPYSGTLTHPPRTDGPQPFGFQHEWRDVEQLPFYEQSFSHDFASYPNIADEGKSAHEKKTRLSISELIEHKEQDVTKTSTAQRQNYTQEQARADSPAQPFVKPQKYPANATDNNLEEPAKASKQPSAATAHAQPKKTKFGTKIVTLKLPSRTEELSTNRYEVWQRAKMSSPIPKRNEIDEQTTDAEAAFQKSTIGSKRKAEEQAAGVNDINSEEQQPPTQRRKTEAEAPRSNFRQMAKGAAIFLAGGIVSTAFLASPYAGLLIDKLA